MLNYIVLLFGVCASAGQGIFNKQYLEKYGEQKTSESFYNFIMSVSRLLMFAFIAFFNLEFNWETIIFALGFSVGAILFQVGFIYALKNGPLSLTSIFVELSMIMPTFYGFIFWKEKVTVFSVIGILFVILSVMLILWKDKKDSEDKKLSLKWLFFVLVAVLGNAFAMIIQKQQQISCEGKYMNLLLLVSFFILFVFFAICYIVDKNKNKVPLLKAKSAVYPLIGGLCNGGINFATMFLATKLPSKIVYPVLTLLTIIITQVFSVALYHEKLTKKQITGLIIGTIAIILLNF